MVSREDYLLAGRGDLTALRRMRDYWFEFTLDLMRHPHLSPCEAIAQLELLAELATSSELAEDYVFLLAAYQVRARSLSDAIAGLQARTATAASDPSQATDLAREINVCTGRLRDYQAKIDALLHASLEDAEAAAILVSGLTTQADGGDERSAGLLQLVLDALSPPRALAVQSQLRSNVGGNA